MLISAEQFAEKIKSLPPTQNKMEGIDNFVNAIAEFMNQMQAGDSGLPGIFTLNNAAMVSILAQQQPVADDSWINNFVSAFSAGCSLATIAPGTAIDPSWVGSGGFDVATVPSAPTTIVTLSTAIAAMPQLLKNVNSESNPPLPLAKAIRDTALSFTFNCIGLGPPPTLTPIPIPLSAK